MFNAKYLSKDPLFWFLSPRTDIPKGGVSHTPYTMGTLKGNYQMSILLRILRVYLGEICAKDESIYYIAPWVSKQSVRLPIGPM